MTRVGSARHDERGKLTGGKAGDQTGKEVSEQNFYVHSKGWFVLRPKSKEHAERIAERMRAACKNTNIGYDQSNRLGVIKCGISSATPTECDCSSLVRACIKEATLIDPGNFTTSNEKGTLLNTGLFQNIGAYRNGLSLYVGDVLVTKTKGHTVIVTEGAKREYTSFFPKCQNKTSFVDGLKEIGADSSKEYRATIAKKNGISFYTGTASQNTKLLNLLREGKLIKP